MGTDSETQSPSTNASFGLSKLPLRHTSRLHMGKTGAFLVENCAIVYRDKCGSIKFKACIQETQFQISVGIVRNEKRVHSSG